VIFASPLRLNLELVCIAKTPARDRLNLWPPLPLVIRSPGYDQTNRHFSTESVDNIIAVLERSDRVCQIELGGIRASRMEELFAAAQVPFPELTHLWLGSELSHEIGPVIPDSFLGGSGPRLEDLRLDRIPFPGLPEPLLSATSSIFMPTLDTSHPG
jgi:hypothetical protein